MARHAIGPRLRRRSEKHAYSARFTIRGREREVSTGCHDRELAEAKADELYELAGGKRGMRAERERRQIHGVTPILRPPAAPGVYVCWCELLPGFVKVGWSRDVRNRLRLLRTGLPGRLYLLAYLPGGKELEAALHAQLRPWRARGEWFHTRGLVLEAISNPGGVSGRLDSDDAESSENVVRRRGLEPLWELPR